MKRRELITLISIVALWPPRGVGQPSKIPIIGFLTARPRDETADSIAAFREGLREAGQTEGESAAIEFRWANGEYDRLPELAADLVEHRVSVIVTSGGNAAAHVALGARAASVPESFRLKW
jgi:putative tryptophan/tyrosine transport system substrate-binding protein